MDESGRKLERSAMWIMGGGGENEVDMDVSIAACLEDSEVEQGLRRSNRLASRSDLLGDARMDS